MGRLMSVIILTGMAVCVFAADSPQFRGPTRDGIFPERGLLKAWPENGPTELWSIEGLGQGYASLSVADGHLYTTGKHDDVGSIFCYDLKGNLQWRKEYGPEHHGGGYPGARSTPTVDGDHVYLISGRGRVVCYDRRSGEQKWAVETLERFGGSKSPDKLIPRWSIAESVLIDGDHVICTPGAPEGTVVALDKRTGDTVWATKGLNELSGYCSPRLFDNGKLRQIITLTGKSLIGIDPANGKLIWHNPYPASWDIHAISPVFHDNLIYVSDGYGHGGKMFRLAEDGGKVTLGWEESTMDVHHGGVVTVDGYIYGAATNGRWICLDFKTGKVVRTTKAVGKGSVVYADGMLYAYGEKGDVGLIKANPQEFEMVSSFEVDKGSGQHWAHPVISNGVLYIRHGNALMAYGIGGN